MNEDDTKSRYPSLSVQDEVTDFLLYTAPSSEVKVEVLLSNETLWLTQKRMAELFSVGVPAISKHLKNIFESHELNEHSVVSILEITAEDRWKTGVTSNFFHFGNSSKILWSLNYEQ